MTGSSPIAYAGIAMDADEIIYSPISPILSGGTNVTPANVPTLVYAWTWEDGTPITWEDDSVMELG